MRNFNWETLPKHSVVGKHNIWTTDKIDGEYELDTDHMEELFSHKQVQQQLKAQNRQSLRGIPTNAPGGEMVSTAEPGGADVTHQRDTYTLGIWSNTLICLDFCCVMPRH